MRVAGLLLLLLCACPVDMRRPASSQLVLNGTLTIGGVDRRGDPLEKAQVTLLGAGAQVLARNTTSSTGGYRLTATVEPGARVLLVAEAADHAPAVRGMTVGPWTELVLSFSLEPLAALECTDNLCTAGVGDLEWGSPPPAASGAVHAFELDDAPLRLVTPGHISALAFVSLDAGALDDGGAPEPGELRLRIPVPEWRTLADARPDSGVFEVDVRSFEASTGAWTSLGPRPLVTEAGLAIAEADGPALTAGTFSGGAVALVPVVASGFVAVIAPSPPTGCIEGTLEADGQPGRGAAVLVHGVEPVTGDAKGAFCLPAPVGEAALPARVQYAGLDYSIDALPAATSAATCGSGCVSAGKRAFGPSRFASTSMCTVAGKVLDASAQARSDVVVVGVDDSVAGSAFTTFCGASGARCALTATSGGDGAFTLKFPVLRGFSVRAVEVAGTDVGRAGSARVDGCPQATVVVRLTRGREDVALAVTYSGDRISWTPARPAARLAVVDSTGAVKWELESASGLPSPVTFGVAPPGARVVTAATGVAAAGDEVTVLLDGTTRDGLQFVGSASATRP